MNRIIVACIFITTIVVSPASFTLGEEPSTTAAIQAGGRLKPTVDLALGSTASGTTSASATDTVVGLSTTWEIDVRGKLASG